MKVREEMKPFIRAMERKMKKNDSEKGDSYKTCSIGYLEDKLLEEVKEYFEKRNRNELPDISNICWMLYERWKGLEKKAGKLFKRW
jgi:predicted house-cleaning noncanonical NTP pyrophosphatase (MazG superfamily)